MELSKKHCVPCEGGVEPFDIEQSQNYLAQTPGWDLEENNNKIWQLFSFKNFREALDFTNKVGYLAESEGHHPDISISWNQVRLTLWTHAIGGLSENDFILASKINNLKAL